MICVHVNRLPHGIWGLCEEDLRRLHEPRGGDNTLLSSRSLAGLPRNCVSPGISCRSTAGQIFCVLQTRCRKTQVALCNQCNQQLWNYETPHVDKTRPQLAHSSAFPACGTFSQYLPNVSFICFNSFQYRKRAAAETPFSPISRILLLRDNLLSKLLPALSSTLTRELVLQFSLVQANRRQCNFQEQILMEKYYVISSSDGGNKVGTECRIPGFTFSALKCEIWYTIR